MSIALNADVCSFSATKQMFQTTGMIRIIILKIEFSDNPMKAGKLPRMS